MPLSKARMRQRKRHDRLLNRFDKAILTPEPMKAVKPKPMMMKEYLVDADGNRIWDE